MEGNSEVVYVYMDGAEGGAVDAESLSQVIQMTTGTVLRRCRFYFLKYTFNRSISSMSWPEVALNSTLFDFRW